MIDGSAWVDAGSGLLGVATGAVVTYVRISDRLTKLENKMDDAETILRRIEDAVWEGSWTAGHRRQDRPPPRR